MDKQRIQLKSAPDYYVGSELVDTSEFKELFHNNEDSGESYDSSYDTNDSYDSDDESTISEEYEQDESDESEDSDSDSEIP